VNEAKLAGLNPSQSVIEMCPVQDPEAELDEMWSFVQSKQHWRWLWHAIDKGSGVVLAYVLAPHHDEAFVKLKALLEAFGVTHFYSDGWGADSRHLDADVHTIGKRNTQKIEPKHLKLQTRIKRLARKTICFSHI
jgi:insertion element IS1 protein InsB